jgi:thioesterase CepJ
MPTVTLRAGTTDEVAIAYDELGPGDADPVLLIAGCGQPALAWQVGVGPVLAAAGYRVITFDNRGVEPSSSPPAPYSVDQMVGDAMALLDHLQIDVAHITGHSMGGWIAETIAARYPERVLTAAFLGSCNPPTSWEKAITTVERDLARLDYDLPPLFYATETMRYLPNTELQDDAAVDTWLSFIGDQEPWPNPGRLGQYEACRAWSFDPAHGASWPLITVPCLIMAYEHDVDSPPARAREAAAIIPHARYVEIPGTSHLAPFTHAEPVAAALVEFFAAFPR